MGSEESAKRGNWVLQAEKYRKGPILLVGNVREITGTSG
jgi:hypothetical protein